MSFEIRAMHFSIFEDDGGLGVLAGRRFSQAEVKGLLAQAGWPANLIDMMSAIVMAESSGYAEAHNPSGEDSWGLAQINRRAHSQYSVAELKQPVRNLQIALTLYNDGRGFRHWGAYTHPPSNPRYMAFMGRGGAAVRPPGGSPANPGTDNMMLYGLAAVVLLLLL